MQAGARAPSGDAASASARVQCGERQAKGEDTEMVVMKFFVRDSADGRRDFENELQYYNNAELRDAMPRLHYENDATGRRAAQLRSRSGFLFPACLVVSRGQAGKECARGTALGVCLLTMRCAWCGAEQQGVCCDTNVTHRLRSGGSARAGQRWRVQPALAHLAPLHMCTCRCRSALRAHLPARQARRTRSRAAAGACRRSTQCRTHLCWRKAM